MQILRKALANLEEILTAALLSVMFLSIFLGVIFRYVLRLPLSWAEELSRYSFIWMVFFGASLVVKRSSHITMEVLPAGLPPAVRKVVSWTAKILVIITSLVLVYSGAKLTISGWSMQTSMLGLPMGLIYSAVPLSGVLTLIRMLQPRPAGQVDENVEGGVV